MGKPPGLAAAVDKRDDPWRSDTRQLSARKAIHDISTQPFDPCRRRRLAVLQRGYGRSPIPVGRCKRHQAILRPAAAAAPAGADAPAAPAAKAQPTLAQRELDFQKRKKEKDEQEKKDRDDSARQLARQEECGRSRQAKAGLDSGARIRTTDPNGERGYMDDAQRAAELARIDKQLAGCPAR